jgi:eukaryotic-like serine/threonine-protein kinase
MASSEQALPAQIGRYRIVRALGQGAMGRVLLAHDPVLDRDVALKLLRSDLGVPADQRRALVERMRQEARASARVSHPNIVALHDMGEDPVLGLYLVFEYVEGATLKDRIARGPLGPEAAAKLAREVGDALGTAHARGVLHRDIKPENVILAPAGAKIADFGIARVPNSTLTKNGKLLGTPAYSAPEAIASGTFSAESDQFSMAATLWEAISGRRAFPGDDATTVAKRITDESPPPIAKQCGLNPHVDAVLSRALAKNPRERYSSCDEFGRALSEALDVAPRTVMQTLPDEFHRHAEQMKSGRAPRLLFGGALAGASLALLVIHFVRVAPNDADAPRAIASSEAGASMGITPAAVAPRTRHHHHRHRAVRAADAPDARAMLDDASDEDGAAHDAQPPHDASVTAKPETTREAGTRPRPRRPVRRR